PNYSVIVISNNPESTERGGQDKGYGIYPNDGYSFYLIFSNLSAETISQEFLNNENTALNAKTLSQLIGLINQKSPTATICIGPDALNLKNALTPEQKQKIGPNYPTAKTQPTDQDLTDLGIDRSDFNKLNTAFLDKAEF